MNRIRPELIALFVLSALTRFWNLSHPNAVVWDEKLYEEYISHYFSGTFYFNLHPPVGKLLLAFAAKFLGIAPETLAVPDPAVALRILPALAGALIIPVFWLLLRQLGASRRVALLGALLLLLDGALLTVSRLILIDSILILFMLGAITAWLASRTRTGPSRWAFITASALLAGLAVGTKWTGLAAPGIIALLWLRETITRREARRQLAGEALLLSAGAAAVYVGSFAVHFALLPLSGPGDDTMSRQFQSTLLRSNYSERDARMSFGAKFVDLHRAMQKGNENFVNATHPGASPWWSWPILKHPLYMWTGDSLADGRKGHLFIEGNPVLWWAILIALGALGGIALAARRLRERLAPERAVLLMLLAAYLINYLPFVFIDRMLFIYSYFPAMIFSLALAVVGAGSLFGWMREGEKGPWKFPTRRSAGLYWGIAGLTLVAFVYFAPLTYGTPISDAAFKRRMWLLERHVLQSETR